MALSSSVKELLHWLSEISYIFGPPKIVYIFLSSQQLAFSEGSVINITGCKSQFRKIFEFKIWKNSMLVL